MHGCLMFTKDVNRTCDELEEAGCVVERDDQAGTVTVKDDGTVVYRAIQKGFGQPWIVMFEDSKRIGWEKPT